MSSKPRIGQVIDVEGRRFRVVSQSTAAPKYDVCRDCSFWHPECLTDEDREEWGTNGCLYVTEGFILGEEHCEDVGLLDEDEDEW